MASINVPGKSSWPELVGKNGGEAATTIISENPNVFVVIIPSATGHITPVSADYNSGRVRVSVDEHCIVTNVPKIG
ncbi:protease inhibitor HPI-like [Punica granatum]|uniref:Protease inhibitor HPI-like n=1 Tax=Punica granatum TaxID=22663 RepID=A0A6P8DTB6_PUNGR|nr:protease inhibitor HPI-like [Punica granatum]